MSSHDGQTQIDEQPRQDVEQELPPADPSDGFQEKHAAPAEAAPAAAPAQPVAEPHPASDAQRLRAERDSLFDRLARLQAEFDNYRKRASKENADFRDYALADAARLLLPAVDNFTLAMKNAQANPEEFRKGVELIYKQL